VVRNLDYYDFREPDRLDRYVKATNKRLADLDERVRKLEAELENRTGDHK
jgi:tetrahydromethanopterin S-methyltransferase subunit G